MANPDLTVIGGTTTVIIELPIKSTQKISQEIREKSLPCKIETKHRRGSIDRGGTETLLLIFQLSLAKRIRELLQNFCNENCLSFKNYGSL